MTDEKYAVMMSALQFNGVLTAMMGALNEKQAIELAHVVEEQYEKFDRILDIAEHITSRESTPQWVSVEYKPQPSQDGAYLVYIKDSSLTKIAYYTKSLRGIIPNECGGGFYDYSPELGAYKIPEITHWMPLPSPPNEQ